MEITEGVRRILEGWLIEKRDFIIGEFKELKDRDDIEEHFEDLNEVEEFLGNNETSFEDMAEFLKVCGFCGKPFDSEYHMSDECIKPIDEDQEVKADLQRKYGE